MEHEFRLEPNASIMVRENIEFRVVGITKDKAIIQVYAPNSVPVYRKEDYEKKRAEREERREAGGESRVLTGGVNC